MFSPKKSTKKASWCGLLIHIMMLFDSFIIQITQRLPRSAQPEPAELSCLS